MPFSPESRISGVERTLLKGEKYLYLKRFFIEKSFVKEKVLLHFGACDTFARVFINGEEYPENKGGFLPFTIDITDSVCVGENLIEVEVLTCLTKGTATVSSL